MGHTPLTPRRPWQGRRIVLGVTGGIAAYKSVQIARDLTRLGALVDVVMTSGAEAFVRPLSFEGVTGRKALGPMFSTDGAALHIRLGHEADAVLVAPATADFLARAAHGRANDLITTTLLATRAPVIVAPAMNDLMFGHPQTQQNLKHIEEQLGYRIAGPGIGPLAFGEGEGPGRMLEPGELVEEVGRALTGHGPIEGKRVLVTAGPTREPIDPVRYIGNRSSGRMGYAIAQAAWRRGAEVTLVTGPAAIPHPRGPEVVQVETAIEMDEAVRRHIAQADITIFSAAVADFRPSEVHDQKMKRADAGAEVQLRLTENPDIAAGTRELRKPGSVCVGFALETDDLVENANKKLEAKGFDMVVANSADEDGAGFDVETNRVTLILRGADPQEFPLLSKHEVAEVLFDHIADRLGVEA